MRKFNSVLTLVLLSVSLFAQSPQKMSYQAVIRNSSDQLVTNHAVGMRISILQGSTDGPEVYKEIYNPNPQTNTNGLVTIEIGSGIASVGTFEGIDWANGTYFIKTETDPLGGTNYTITGISQLLSVPYALYAETSGTPGVKGDKGDTGDQGLKGDQGDPGADGADGLTTSVNGVTQVNGDITLTKSDIGLGNVDNTSDINKPVSSATQTVLDIKVDNEVGKGLSTNDFSTPEKSKLASITGTNTGDQDLSGKVDKVTGKGLSSEDYTTVEKTKLGGIASGAEVNVNADWNAVNGDAKILNRPNLAAVATSGSYIDLVSKPSNIDEDKSDDVTISGNQTITGIKTFTNTITGTLNANNTIITNVATPVNDKDAVNKAYVALSVSTMGDTLFLGNGQHIIIPGISGANIPAPANTVPDLDGNIYGTINIGTQVWMAENLKTTKYRNGELIETTTPANLNISTEYLPKYQWSYDGNETNVATYGRLYTWFAVTDSRSICPVGWHVPTDREWKTLEMFLGLTQTEADATGWRGTDEGNKLKSSSGWDSGGSGTNTSGFSGLPGGIRGPDGTVAGLGNLGTWWTSSESNSTVAEFRSLTDINSNINRSNNDKTQAYSVRCLRDINSSVVAPTLSTSVASSITATSVITGGNISNNGGGIITDRGVCWSTSLNPTITNNKTNDGTGNGAFISSINGLAANTTYYVRAYATNSVGTAYGNEISFITISSGTSTITDVSGNIYNAVTIGTQIWMSENLKTTMYNDGSSISIINNETVFGDPGYLVYGDINTFGLLYNWFAVSATTNGGKNICPTAWHVPTEEEWVTMENYLITNGYNYDGTTSDNKISKSLASAPLWIQTVTEGAIGNEDYPEKANITGFSALPAGLGLSVNGFTGSLYSWGYLWSSSSALTTLAWSREFCYNESSPRRTANNKSWEFSVRCVKD